MIAEFLGFILSCFMMVVKLFKNTVIDGISYDVLIVSVWMLGIVIGAMIIRFRPTFRAPRDRPSLPQRSNKSDKKG